MNKMDKQKFTKSFYEWCMENNHQDFLDRWDYELNEVSPKEISLHSSKKYYFKCLENKNHKSELHGIAGVYDGRSSLSCYQCNSFGQWCLDNDRVDILNRWDYDLNDCDPFRISKASGVKCYFKCPNNIHESELKVLYSLTNGKVETFYCNKCNSFAQWGIDNLGEDFLEKYWDYDKNTVDPWDIAHAYNKKVWLICQNKEYHGSYQISPNKFIKGKRCPYCSKSSGKVHRLDSLGYLYPEVLEVWSDKNKKSPYEYSPKSGLKVWFKCKSGRHEDYSQQIGNAVNRGFRCPQCIQEMSNSILQEKVKRYISETYQNYTLLHEYDCKIKPVNPKTGHILLFDNEILELKLVCEVMGEQHYKPTQFNKLNAKRNHITPEESLKELQWRDNYKKEYALSYGYNYLEIPYTAFNKKDDYKKMIDDKIKSILNS